MSSDMILKSFSFLDFTHLVAHRLVLRAWHHLPHHHFVSCVSIISVNGIPSMSSTTASTQIGARQLPTYGAESKLSLSKPFECSGSCIRVMLFIFVVLPLMFITTTVFGSGYDKLSFPSNSLTVPAEGEWLTSVHVGGMYLHIFGGLFILWVWLSCC